MMRWRLARAIALFFGMACAATGAEIRVTDDSGRVLMLSQPARRIISLAPHIVELLFAAGAGSQVVGTVEYSSYPEAATRIPRIGDSAQLDLERIVALKPDLIIIWQHGNAQRQLNTLLKFGIPIYYNEPRSLADIARSIEQFGLISGNEALANSAGRDFTRRTAALRSRYTGRPAVRVFYQIWENPLMTINGEHIISDMLRLCGGVNVFAALKPLAPVISTEAVLAANPEVIGGATAEVNTSGRLDNWQKWTGMLAVARGNLFVVHTDLISRHTPRMLTGVQQICEHIEMARTRRPNPRQP